MGKFASMGENYSCCSCVEAKLLAPKWHSGRNGATDEDPFFLGWIRTKARKKRRRGEEPIPGRGCKRRWRRRRRKLKRKCGTLETAASATATCTMTTTRGRQCDCSLASSQDMLLRRPLPVRPSVQKELQTDDPVSFQNMSLF